MAKFRYKMQNILDVKTNLESQAKQEFAQANNRLLEEQEKLKNLREQRENYMNHYEELLKSKLDFLEINLAKTGILQTEEKIRRQLVQVKTAERNLEASRRKLENLMQERKTQERLKEKALEAFLKEENAKEQKEVDELVSFRYGQKDQKGES